VSRLAVPWEHSTSGCYPEQIFLLKYGLDVEPGKKFVNTRHDMDLLALLHYGSAIASDETSGDLATAMNSLYDGTRKQITSKALLSGASAIEIQVAAFYNWINNGQKHGNALSDWLSAESRIEFRHMQNLIGNDTERRQNHNIDEADY
jgi:hypothetical protein